jgi:hypothetical protein
MASRKNAMNTKEFLERCENLYKKCLITLKKKNEDYSGDNDNAYRNFEAVERFNITELETGIMVRLTDKFTRIANLVNKRDPSVKDESIKDSIEDAINYLAILYVSYERKDTDTEIISKTKK